MKTKKMTFDQALSQLKETRQLNTAMLAPFDLSMEVFLRYCQVSDEHGKEFIDRLIVHLENKGFRKVLTK